MSRTGVKRKPATLYKSVQHVRMALGLPIYRVDNGKAPYGYYYKDGDQRICVPDVRLLRLLRKAYELKDSGVELQAICDWIYKNCRKNIPKSMFSRLYYERPIFKEIELPLHERRRLYETSFTQAEKAKEDLYKYCQAEANEKAKGDSSIQEQSGSGESNSGAQSSTPEDYSI